MISTKARYALRVMLDLAWKRWRLYADQEARRISDWRNY